MNGNAYLTDERLAEIQAASEHYGDYPPLVCANQVQDLLGYVKALKAELSQAQRERTDYELERNRLQHRLDRTPEHPDCVRPESPGPHPDH